MARRSSARHTRIPGMSRRSLMQGASGLALGTYLGTRATGAGAATLVQSTPTVDISGTSLSILQWQHFVPAFDEWFPTFLQEWGDANGVEVSVDGGAWEPATLTEGGDSAYTWAFWTYDWTAPAAGEHTVTSRATDVDGNVQPAPDDPLLAGKTTYWESNGHITRTVAIG